MWKIREGCGMKSLLPKRSGLALGSEPGLKGCMLVMAVTAALSPLYAQTVVQDFESWPETTSFGTYTNNGWVISDGQVRSGRGGFGSTIGLRSGWLNDADCTSNTWLRSPLMEYGIARVRFQVRPGTTSSGEQVFEVQQSHDGTNWVTVQLFDRLGTDWTEASCAVGVQTPAYVRIVKTQDAGTNDYLGLDEVYVVPPPGVVLSELTIDPKAPTFSTPVHVFVKAVPGPHASNAVLTAYYRFGTSGVYQAISMTNIAGHTYRTLTPIPPGFRGTVQYYVRCDYDGPGDSPVYYPESAPGAPASFDTTNPFLNQSLRQLDPSTHRTPLIISEIMYNAGAMQGTNKLEFVEIFNTEPVARDIGGYRLAGDIAYTFPLGTTIGPREFIVVARDPQTLAAHYGIANIHGPYEGALPGNGGRVRLRNREGAILLEVNYRTNPPWPVAADGAGHSLWLAYPDYGEDDHRAWSASLTYGGTPGTAETRSLTAVDRVVINEFLAHTDLPQVDFIELYNASTQTVDIGGCWLSDTPALNKFMIPSNTFLSPRGFIVFWQTNLGFSLSMHGDEIYLRDRDGRRVIDAGRFPAQANGVSSGRYPDGSGDFYVLQHITPGSINAHPRVEDIVINEIMFHPISGSDDDEYVELYNRGTNPVNVSNWRFTEGISFTIPQGTVIPPDGYLVVARNITNLLARYPQLNTNNTAGNYSGSLANGGERIVLSRPDDPEQPDIDFVVVNEVEYGDDQDWGLWIDGGGSSMELIDPRSDNRRPMNWAGSDESGKAGWTTLNYTGIVDMGAGTPNQIRIYHLQAGECVLDDLLIKSGATKLLEENFEGDISSWYWYGNHSRSSRTTGVGVGDSKGLVIRATGPGNQGVWSGWSETFWNHIGAPLWMAPPSGSLVGFHAKLRWQAGWPYLVAVLRGFWAEASIKLDIPNNLGSPGLRNSRYRANQGPAIDQVEHFPVLPAAGEPAVVSCRVHDPDGINGVFLAYRIDPGTNVWTVAMNDSGTDGDALAGDGRYSAMIPGQAQGTLVAFWITAVDAAAAPATNRYPEPGPTGWPVRECLIRFGDPRPPGSLGTYRFWITAANINRWTTITGGRYSNEPIDVTFVSGDYRVIYNAGARWRGLWRSYGNPCDSGAYSVEFPLGRRFLGQNELKLDQIGQNGSDATRQNEGFTFWMARRIGVPAPEFRYVRLIANGNQRPIMHDLQIPSRDMCRSWYEDDDPTVYKHTGWIGDPFDRRIDGLGQYKQAVYRWNSQRKLSRIPNDDYTPIYALAEASATTDTAAYLARMQALLNVRDWVAFFAICGAVGDWDHWGWSYSHNSYAYVPDDRGAAVFIYDMDNIGQASSLFPNNHVLPPKMFRSEHAPFRRQFYAILKELAEGPLTPSEAEGRLDAWYRAFVANGANVEYPTWMKNLCASVRTSILTQLTPFNVSFAVTNNGGQSFSTTNVIVRLGGYAPLNVDRIEVNGIRQKVTFTNEVAWTTQIGFNEGTNRLEFAGYDWRGTLVATCGITVLVTATPPSPSGQVIISEIMYHPKHHKGEYVELYNRGPDTFDLRGWRLNGADLIFDGGTILRPRQYAVVAENLTAYQRAYSNAEVVVARFNGNLDNGGETLTLEQPDEAGGWITVNRVTYDDDPPWPREAAGRGQALQLIDVNQDNTVPGNWGCTPDPEPIWKQVTVTGVLTNDSIRFTANAALYLYVDQAGGVQVDNVVLVTGTVAEAGENLLQNGDFETPLTGTWATTGTHFNSYITHVAPLQGTGSLQIVASGSGQPVTDAVWQRRPLTGYPLGQPFTLSFWYRQNVPGGQLCARLALTTVSTNVDFTSPPIPPSLLYSPGQSNTISATLPFLPSLRINEIMPSNSATWADSAGDFDPWIEIYNCGTTAVDLADFRLSNDLNDLGLWAFPSGTVIGATNFLMIWADGEVEETQADELHASFRLHATTGTAVLSRAYEDRFLVLDVCSYLEPGSDRSWGLYPDGNAARRQTFDTPTPGYANNPTSLPVTVFINEWMARNDSTLLNPLTGKYDDWFELYNASPHPINLGGYYLTDNLTQSNRFRVPGGYILQPGAFLLVWADGTGINTGSDLHVNFKLDNAGEEIGVFRPDRTLADAVSFGPMSGDMSLGRWPNGTETIYVMNPPTPGASNSVLRVNRLPASEPTGNAYLLSWEAKPGRTYRIDYSTNLNLPVWSNLTEIIATGSVITFQHTNPPVPAVFYRVSLRP